MAEEVSWLRIPNETSQPVRTVHGDLLIPFYLDSVKRHWLTRAWRLENKQNSKYVEIRGALDHLFAGVESFDTDVILQAIDGPMSVLRENLLKLTPEQRRRLDGTLTLEDVEELYAAIEAGKEYEIADALASHLWRVGIAVKRLIDDLEISETIVSSTEGLVAAYASAVHGNIFYELYMQTLDKLETACLEYLREQDYLRGRFERFKTLRKQIEEYQRDANRYQDASHPDLVDLFAQLDRKSPLMRTMSDFKLATENNGQPSDDLLNQALTASGKVADVQREIRLVSNAFEDRRRVLIRQIQNCLGPELIERDSQALRVIKSALDVIAEYRDLDIKPYQILDENGEAVENSSLPQEKFDLVVELTHSYEWGNQPAIVSEYEELKDQLRQPLAEAVFEGKVTALLARCNHGLETFKVAIEEYTRPADQSDLSEELAEVVELVPDVFPNLVKDLAQEGVRTDQNRKPQIGDTRPAPTLAKPASKPTIVYDTDPARAAALYDLLLAVAYVRHANNKGFNQMTIGSSLRILARLGLCTETEAIEYASAVTALVEADTEVLKVPKFDLPKVRKADANYAKNKASWEKALTPYRERLNELRTTCTKRWVRFRLGLLNSSNSTEMVYKLTSHTFEEAKKRYEQLEAVFPTISTIYSEPLTPDLIKRISQQLRSERDAAAERFRTDTST